ncbi:transmembrane protein, putative (macronuclear) [Tetrahymena thermophila SB210]|uniref:Transmembrane protein, putative n=1 Tax=Tetrahymena thermophila (strain SB210) TaxID=312017 RepID=I7LV28_TETTS|nr:transmembrane protein, putative [Tetrahymena thermophila SB210]EAR96535.3 transmembrane protein, putative [Tetrahymena thermophila SB210]|eukprot:XP_001016780.3 transmembrane protein, putative [Tetrahymena thermophila SB210]
MRNIFLLHSMIIMLIQISFIQSQCTTVNNLILKVNTPTDQQSVATTKSYQLVFQDINLNLKYTPQNGVYTISTSQQGASLYVNSNSGSPKQYSLQQILIRGTPMFQINKTYYDMEMQLYFTGTDNIVLSIFLDPILNVSSLNNSQFFENMDPQIIGDQQSINLSNTLQNDFQNKTFVVYENPGITYLSQTYTWLMSSQLIQIDYQTFELFRLAINDPYVTQFYDQVNFNLGTCDLPQATVYAISIYSSLLIVTIAQFMLFLL